MATMVGVVDVEVKSMVEETASSAPPGMPRRMKHAKIKDRDTDFPP
jgi:hypothetical protein